MNDQAATFSRRILTVVRAARGRKGSRGKGVQAEMRAANGSPGSISIHSFRRLSLSVRQLAATERDSDDEFSGEEEEVEDEEVLRNMEDKPIDAGDVPTTSQHPSSFNEKV